MQGYGSGACTCTGRVCSACICIPIIAWDLAVQVGAAPLADGHVLRARVHVLVVVLQRLHPVGVRVERRAAAQPLGHVLDRARRGRGGDQRLACLRAHLVPAHVNALKRERAAAQRVGELERVAIAPAITKDFEREECAGGAHKCIAQRLNGHRRVMATPLPVDAAELILAELELAQRVVGRAQPRAHSMHGIGEVPPRAIRGEAAYAVVRQVEELERTATTHHRLHERHRAVDTHLVAAQVELPNAHRARAERFRKHARALLGEAIVREGDARDRGNLARLLLRWWVRSGSEANQWSVWLVVSGQCGRPALSACISRARDPPDAAQQKGPRP